LRIYVGFKVFDTLIDPAAINRARAVFGEKMQVIGPKLQDSGVFAGKREGFMLLDVASQDEAFALFAELADFCEIEIHLVSSFEVLASTSPSIRCRPPRIPSPVRRHGNMPCPLVRGSGIDTELAPTSCNHSQG